MSDTKKADMEKWKAVVDWEGRYEVSDHGRVRSLDRQVNVTTGPKSPYSFWQPGKILRAAASKNGYPLVVLSRQTEGLTYRYVHDLVTEAFLGQRPAGLEVCHNDGTRDNARLSNLRYDSRSANALDRHLHGTMNQPQGEACPSAKLTEQDVRWIRANQGAMSLRAMARELGVSHKTTSAAARGIWWAHVV